MVLSRPTPRQVRCGVCYHVSGSVLPTRYTNTVPCCKAGEASPTLDCKGSRGRLFVPVPVAAVAHGDANLGVEEFLSRAFRDMA